jgi:hypothetical protein
MTTSLGSRLISVANGIQNPGEAQFLRQQAIAELNRRAAPPPIGKPGAAMALLRAAYQQKGKSDV